RFDVVDDRRGAEDSDDSGEGRLDARLAALAFEALDQPGLFAADVGAGAAVDGQVERVSGAEDVLSEKNARVGFLQRAVQNARAEIELAADVDVGVSALQSVGGEDDSLDDLMWILLHQQPVFECPWLGLVGVAEEIDRLALRVLRDKPPFDA